MYELCISSLAKHAPCVQPITSRICGWCFTWKPLATCMISNERKLYFCLWGSQIIKKKVIKKLNQTPDPWSNPWSREIFIIIIHPWTFLRVSKNRIPTCGEICPLLPSSCKSLDEECEICYYAVDDFTVEQAGAECGSCIGVSGVGTGIRCPSFLTGPARPLSQPNDWN